MATIILKVTHACNSKCLYCDVVHNDHAGPTAMPLNVLEQLFLRINEFLLQAPDEKIELIWHGGEPLLLGPNYYTQALALQQQHCPNTSDRIHHAIQTNLSLFTPEFASVLRKFGITSVGTSYDPIAGVRGPGKIPDTQAYNERFMRGAEIAEAEGFGWGVIYVVTQLTLAQPLDVFYFMTNLKPDGGVNFHQVLVYGPEPQHLTITPEEFADFLGTIFPLYWQHQDRFRRVEPFSSLLRNAKNGIGSLGCVETGLCGDKYWSIAPNGAVSHCGRSGDWNLLNYGSIFTKTLEEMRRDLQREVFIGRNAVLSQIECQGCRFWLLCHGGCPLDSWAVTQSFQHQTYWCAAKKIFLEKYFEPITGLRLECGVADGPRGRFVPQTHNEAKPL